MMVERSVSRVLESWENTDPLASTDLAEEMSVTYYLSDARARYGRSRAPELEFRHFCWGPDLVRNGDYRWRCSWLGKGTKCGAGPFPTV